MTETLDGELLTVAFKGRAARFLVPSLQDHISRELHRSKAFYEEDFLAALGSVLTAGDNVLDIGANIGNHSVYFAKMLECNVIAFEAVESTARYLQHNVDLNFLAEFVEVRSLAVGALPGTATISSYDEANIGATRLSRDDDGDVLVTSLDAEHISGKVRLIKVDVEGMELDVLIGATHLIRRDRPFIACEAVTNKELLAIRDLLRPFGYRELGVFNATPTYLFAPTDHLSQCVDVIQFQNREISRLRAILHELGARIDRSNRYTERLHREALARVAESAEAIRREPKTVDFPPAGAGEVSEQLGDNVTALAERLRDLETKLSALSGGLQSLRQELTEKGFSKGE